MTAERGKRALTGENLRLAAIRALLHYQSDGLLDPVRDHMFFELAGSLALPAPN